MSEISFWYHLPVKESVRHTFDCAMKAEEVGFDTASQMDHFLYESKQRGCKPECWTMLSSVASRTGLTVSPLVMCSLFRNPALLAKMVTTLDQLTRGRVHLGIGAGWWEREFKAYGYPWLSASKRVDRTVEATQIIKKLWTEERVNFDGRFWKIEDCELVPKPYSKPHPIIWNGGSGPRMLRMAGQLCDGWVTGNDDPEQVAEKMDYVREHSAHGKMLFGHYLTVGRENLGIEQARERIERFSDIGVTHFMILLNPDSDNFSMLDDCPDLISSFK